MIIWTWRGLIHTTSILSWSRRRGQGSCQYVAQPAKQSQTCPSRSDKLDLSPAVPSHCASCMEMTGTSPSECGMAEGRRRSHRSVLEAFLAGQPSSWLNDGGAANRVVWLHAEPSCRADLQGRLGSKADAANAANGCAWMARVECSAVVASQSSKNGDAAPEVTDWEGGDPRPPPCPACLP
jgi:hypothetical protein